MTAAVERGPRKAQNPVIRALGGEVMLKAILVIAALLAPWAVQAQAIIKCVGKDGKTYVGSTLPPQCQGQAVKRTEAMLTPEQRAAKEAEMRIAKEKEAEAARKEQEESRKNKALLS